MGNKTQRRSVSTKARPNHYVNVVWLVITFKGVTLHGDYAETRSSPARFLSEAF